RENRLWRRPAGDQPSGYADSPGKEWLRRRVGRKIQRHGRPRRGYLPDRPWRDDDQGRRAEKARADTRQVQQDQGHGRARQVARRNQDFAGRAPRGATAKSEWRAARGYVDRSNLQGSREEELTEAEVFCLGGRLLRRGRPLFFLPRPCSDGGIFGNWPRP